MTETQKQKIIGAGFGRTGTSSIMNALEQLGYRVFHMQVIGKGGQGVEPLIYDMANGYEPSVEDLQQLGEHYDAFLDFPMCSLYDKLLQAFPDGHILLSQFEEDKWLDSFSHTILPLHKILSKTLFARQLPPLRRINAGNKILFQLAFQNDLSAENIKKQYAQHNDNVQHNIPQHQLTCYHVEQGWAPIARIAGVTMPDNAFPHINDKQEFRRLIMATLVIEVVAYGSIFVGLFAVIAVQ